jgi:hypothetical protein
MNSIATMGKFNDVPTRKSSLKYGGGSTATWPTHAQIKHKFPSIRITKIEQEKQTIDILINNIEEE